MKPTFHEELLEEPMKGTIPQRIFVCSTGDMFGEWVPFEWKERVFEIVARCPQHIFQFYTKNPKGMIGLDFPSNCWAGISVATDKDAFRLAYFNMIRCDFKFVSVEPILEAVDIPDSIMKKINWCVIGARTDRNAYTGVDPRKAQAHARPLIARLRHFGVPIWIKDSMKIRDGFPADPFPTDRDIPIPKQEQGTLFE